MELVLLTLAASIVAAGTLVVLMGLSYLLGWKNPKKHKKPRKPKRTKIVKIERSEMADQLRCTLAIPAPGAGDVVTREMHVLVDDTETVYNLTPDARTFTLDLAEGSNVTIFLVDVDNNGNKSEPSESLSFTVVDTLPPPKPGKPDIIGVEEPGYQTGMLATNDNDFLKAAKAFLKH